MAVDWGLSRVEWHSEPAAWIHRGGRSGEFEEPFIEKSTVAIGWELQGDLGESTGWDDLSDRFRRSHPELSPGSIPQFTRMIWDFLVGYKQGDLIVMPRRGTQEFAVGRVTGPYIYNSNPKVGSLWHERQVEWLVSDIHKSAFPPDISRLLAPRRTIQRITPIGAHERILAVIQNPGAVTPQQDIPVVDDHIDGSADIESIGREQIAQFIEANYKTHDFSALVAQVLEAQGYKTFVSPPGPDGGVDILGGIGALGLDSPKLCVQVKSGNVSVDRMTLDQLIGTMQNFGAEQGLLVSWGGFKKSVRSVQSNQWFKVRLWDRDAFIDALLEVFDKLDEDLRSTLPFKQVWTLSVDPRL
jgi:restriction system protein